MQDADVRRVQIYAHTRTLHAGDLHVCLQPLASYVRIFSLICQGHCAFCEKKNAMITLHVIKLPDALQTNKYYT
jgi:translation initiation factor RLI1